MGKTKLEFVNDLLATKKLKSSEKEKIFSLAEKELRNDASILTSFEVESNGTVKRSEENSENGDTDLNRPEKRHRPKDVAEFMSLFNNRDGLKYLTHDYDEEGFYDVEKFLKQARSVFYSQTNRTLSIPSDLWQIINRFAFESHKNWGEFGEIKEGFSSPEWIEWSKKNKLHPIKNEKFKGVIEKFRDLTRISPPRLEQIIQECIKNVFSVRQSELCISQNDLGKADFYTNIASFKRSIYSIFSEIDKHKHNKIDISYSRSNHEDYYLRRLVILQHGSFPAKEMDLLVKEWKSGKGSMGGIRNNLMGYCDWSVETKIEGKGVRFNILKDEQIPEMEDIKEEEVLGFKHIMTFYYK